MRPCSDTLARRSPLRFVLPVLAVLALALASCAPAAPPTPTPAPPKPAAPAAQPTPAPKPAAPAPTTAPTAAPKPGPGGTPPAPTAVPAKPGPGGTPPTAAPAASKPSGRDKVQVRTTWKISGQDSPYWLGLDKGFYAEEGIDAEVSEGTGSATALQTVAAGADHFTVSLDLATLMKAIGNGMPVKSTGTIYQKSATGVSAHASANVKTIKDLVGKSVHFVPTGSTAQIFPALLKLNGIDPTKVTIVNLEQLAGKQAFLAKRVDAMGSYATNEAIELQVQGVPTTFVSFSDYAPLLGSGVVTSEKLIKENPELVRRFLRAIRKTWAYAVENPEETAAVAVKRFPVLEPSRQLLVAQVKSLRSVVETEDSKKLPWGTHQQERWEKAQDFLLQVGLVEKKLKVEQYFTNEFLPK